MMKKEKIVVMGGSFNPPTIAHLKIIQAALNGISAEKGYLAPVSHAYLKRKMVKVNSGHLCLSDELRLSMLRSMCADDPRIDIYTGEMREVFAVTYETMCEMQKRHPDADIYFIVGADKLSLIEEFGRKSDFLERFGVIVFTRDNADLEEEIKQFENLSTHRGSLIFLAQPSGIEAISSTAIRKNLFDIDKVKSMLHPAVIPFLKELKESDFPEEIIQFNGDYDFLDNKYPLEIKFEGLVYPSAASAFQASKILDTQERVQFTEYAHDKAMLKGSTIAPYPEWEDKKLSIMEEIVREKFTQHPDLLNRLAATKGKILIAGNKKKEKYWNVNLTTWEGENQLGKILMKVRSELVG